MDGDRFVEERAKEYPQVPKEFLKAHYNSLVATDPKFRQLFSDYVSEKEFRTSLSVRDPNVRAQFMDAVTRENPGLSLADKSRLYAEYVAKAEGVERAFEQYHKSVIRDLHRTITSMPDKEVTEDRAAVVEAIRRGIRNDLLPEPPPSLGGMSNAEYRQHVRQQYGYDTNV